MSDDMRPLARRVVAIWCFGGEQMRLELDADGEALIGRIASLLAAERDAEVERLRADNAAMGERLEWTVEDNAKQRMAVADLRAERDRLAGALREAADRFRFILERSDDEWVEAQAGEGEGVVRAALAGSAPEGEGREKRLEALARFARHDADCAVRDGEDCSCGYSAALDAAGEG